MSRRASERDMYHMASKGKIAVALRIVVAAPIAILLWVVELPAVIVREVADMASDMADCVIDGCEGACWRLIAWAISKANKEQ